MSVGKRIRQIRKEQHISQTNLAHCCEFGKSQLSRIEAGKTNMTMATLKQISDCLQVSPGVFFVSV